MMFSGVSLDHVEKGKRHMTLFPFLNIPKLIFSLPFVLPIRFFPTWPPFPAAPVGSSATESAIWKINPTTKQITGMNLRVVRDDIEKFWLAPLAQWVNSDGSRPRTSIGFDIRNNHIVLTGDISAYNAANTWPLSEVVRHRINCLGLWINPSP